MALDWPKFGISGKFFKSYSAFEWQFAKKSFSAEENDKNLPKNGKNSIKNQFFSFFTGKIFKEKLIFLKMPKAAPMKPYYFRKLHLKLCLISLPKHGAACGILQKMTHQYCRTVASTTTVASTNKLVAQFFFFFLQVQHSNKPTVIFDEIWNPQLD